MRVRISQIDGKLPNLALMRLSAWHKAQGDEVHWVRGHTRQLNEPDYDIVYASAIFETSAKAVEMFRRQWPQAIIGGSGGDKDLRVEDIVPTQFLEVDYSGYPDFRHSIGYAMRGCRYKCGWCVVPRQEGTARSALPIHQIWRGDGHPKEIQLLDNDFFGNPDWREVVRELNNGGFKVCINQGINVRALSGRPELPGLEKRRIAGTLTEIDRHAIIAAENLANEQAAALASLQYKDDQFKRPRLYTAWDMLGDEQIFFEGVDRLEQHGIPPQHLMAYMLVGYNPRETWDDIFHRYQRMMDRGVRPYPMVYGEKLLASRPDHWKRLKHFQAWVITGAHKVEPFERFNPSHRANVLDDRQLPLFSEIAQ